MLDLWFGVETGLKLRLCVWRLWCKMEEYVRMCVLVVVVVGVGGGGHAGGKICATALLWNKSLLTLNVYVGPRKCNILHVVQTTMENLVFCKLLTACYRYSPARKNHSQERPARRGTLNCTEPLGGRLPVMFLRPTCSGCPREVDRLKVKGPFTFSEGFHS